MSSSGRRPALGDLRVALRRCSSRDDGLRSRALAARVVTHAVGKPNPVVGFRGASPGRVARDPDVPISSKSSRQWSHRGASGGSAGRRLLEWTSACRSWSAHATGQQNSRAPRGSGRFDLAAPKSSSWTTRRRRLRWPSSMRFRVCATSPSHVADSPSRAIRESGSHANPGIHRRRCVVTHVDRASADCVLRPTLLALTGLVLPAASTPLAQQVFEHELGGFGQGFRKHRLRREFRAYRWKGVPVWLIGAGENTGVPPQGLRSGGMLRRTAGGWSCGLQRGFGAVVPAVRGGVALSLRPVGDRDAPSPRRRSCTARANARLHARSRGGAAHPVRALSPCGQSVASVHHPAPLLRECVALRNALRIPADHRLVASELQVVPKARRTTRAIAEGAARRRRRVSA